jgi:DNA-binding XRE family transcriptional regulator
MWGVIMITCYPVLRQQMIENGTTLKDLAAVAGVSLSALRLKMWGIKRWKLTEAVSICCFFHTQEVEHLFRKSRFFVCSRTL